MKPSVIALSLATLLPTIADADSSFELRSGLSYVNRQNLQSSQIAGISGTASSSRTGLQLDGSWQWQQVTPQGGYSVSGDANLNRGLDGAGNIRSVALGGGWMHAINPRWLTRINLRLGDYRDDNQPAYNTRSGGGGLALGWFGNEGAGADLNASWQRERYDDDPVGPYQADRITLGGRYYFPHLRDAPYWSAGVEIGRFEADQSGYSYDSSLLSVGYSSWHWQRLEGDILFLWRSNRYDDVPGNSTGMDHASMNHGSMAMNGSYRADAGSNDSQQDDYLSVVVDLRYPLRGPWRLVSNLNAGQYRSNVAEDQPLLGFFLGIAVRY